MSTTDSTNLYRSMLAGSGQDDAPVTAVNAPHPMWRWFWLGLMLAALPLLIPYFIGLWENPTYRYFPFAIGVAGWLTYARSDGHFYPPRGWFSWIAIAFGLFSIVFGTVLAFPWFAAVAFVIFATAMLFAMRGPDDHSLIAVALPLLTVVRLIRADVLLVLFLQNITTWMSSVLLDTMAVPHAVTNNVIQLADRELFVAEACSGIQSFFTLSFLALTIVAWKRRRIWMAPLYVVIAGLLAIFANVIRVTVVALAANFYQFDLAEGWPHELLGYIALAIAFGFMLSFDYLIATFLHRIPQETEFNPLISGWNFLSIAPEEEQSGRGTRGGVMELVARDQRSSAFQWAQRWVGSRWARIAFVCLVAVICIASLSTVLVSRKPTRMVGSDETLVFDPPVEVVSQSFAVLDVIEHRAFRGYQEPRLGANSDIWECNWDEIDEVSVQLVLSQPHRGWHELCDCYERLDWRLLNRDILAADDFETFEVAARNPDALLSTYVLARFKRGPAQHGYLIFSAIGSDGTLLDAPDSLSAFTHRVWNRIDTTGVWEQNEVLMLQMWITSPEKIKPRRLQKLQEDFVSARGKLADLIAENAGRTLPSAPQPEEKDAKADAEGSVASTSRFQGPVGEAN